ATPNQASDDPATASIEPRGSTLIDVNTVPPRILICGQFGISDTIKSVKSHIEYVYEIPAALQKLSHCGKLLDDTKTLEQSGVTDSQTVGLSLDTRQTMIYLVAPSGKGVLNKVEVKLSSDRTWELAALYPSIAPPKECIQSTSWTVDVDEFGRLVDCDTQTQLSCLFWDGL
ncbi:hypothetical protein FRC06_007965, partial [Ceratobasidium sp. 370]